MVTLALGDYSTIWSVTTVAEPVVLASCQAFRDAGYDQDGVYTIDPTGSDPFDVYCDMTFDGGGWALVGSWSSPAQSGTSATAVAFGDADTYLKDSRYATLVGIASSGLRLSQDSFNLRIPAATPANSCGKNWRATVEPTDWYDVGEPRPTKYWAWSEADCNARGGGYTMAGWNDNSVSPSHLELSEINSGSQYVQRWTGSGWTMDTYFASDISGARITAWVK